MGFRSGDWLGHPRTSICFVSSLSSPSLQRAWGRCRVETPSVAPNTADIPRHGSYQPICPVCDGNHLPVDAYKVACPRALKTAPQHDAATTMLDGRDGVLGLECLSLFSPHCLGCIVPKKFYLHLIRPEYSVPLGTRVINVRLSKLEPCHQVSS